MDNSCVAPLIYSLANMFASDIVVAFHGIGVPSQDVPAEERPYWITEDLFASFISDALSRAKTLGVNLRVTFDDGNRSDLEIAAPILARHGMAGSFFPCAGRVSRSGYLAEDDIRTLFRMGFEIGSHGMDHVPWSSLDGPALDREVAGSKSAFQTILGVNIVAAAIPFGSYNRRVLAALRAAGYTRVYNSDRGFSRPGAWMSRRWSYRPGEPFELDNLVAASSSLWRRATVAAKGAVKALR